MDFENIKKEQEKKSKLNKFIKALAIILIILVLFGVYGFIDYLLIKNAAKYASEGRETLTSARKNIIDKEFELAANDFDSANQIFKKAQRNIYFSYPLIIVPKLGTNVLAVSRILTAGINTTAALSAGSRLANGIFADLKSNKDLSYNQLSHEQKVNFVSQVYSSYDELNKIKKEIDSSLSLVKKIPVNKVYDPIKNAAVEFESNLTEAEEIMDQILPFTQIFPRLAGYPEARTYLFLLENNTELRPTGGFIGNFGVLKVQNGELLSLEAYNTYSLDLPMEGLLEIEPPLPIKKYLEVPYWFMRDANWSPDFRTSAEKIEWFYHTEHGPEAKIDGVIGVVPDLVEKLLDIVGPQEIEGDVYSSSNFTNTLEYRVSVKAYELDEDFITRKKIIDKLMHRIKDQLFEMPLHRWNEVVKVISSSLDEKNILIYDKNKKFADVLEQNNWNGGVRQLDSDFLMVVDANLGALKTDPVMDRKIDYTLSQKENGDIIARAEIIYTNNGTFSRTTTRYRTYTRVYVPFGSQIINYSGLMENDRTNVPGQIEIGQELNKTYFGGFIAIEPGQTNKLVLEYKLPEEIKKKILASQYEIYIQKQPGVNNTLLNVDLTFLNKIKSYRPVFAGSKLLNSNHIRFEGDLRIDRDYIVNF